MAKRQSATEKAQKEMEALVAGGLKEPGVAEAVELYERAESAYAAIFGATRTSESAANSTSDESLSRR
jgi:hypothetical protein